MRFVFIDEILDMVSGASIHAVKTMPASEGLFQDHFPGFPVVPGVLLIEMMAQAAGKCLDAEGPGRGKAMLVQVRRGSFRRWVRPDQVVHIHATITSSTAVSASAAARISVEQQAVADAELVFGFLSASQLAPGLRDEVLERYLAAKRQAGTQR